MLHSKNCEPECHRKNEGKGSYGVVHGRKKGWRSILQACKVQIERQTEPTKILKIKQIMFPYLYTDSVIA